MTVSSCHIEQPVEDRQAAQVSHLRPRRRRLIRARRSASFIADEHERAGRTMVDVIVAAIGVVIREGPFSGRAVRLSAAQAKLCRSADRWRRAGGRARERRALISLGGYGGCAHRGFAGFAGGFAQRFAGRFAAFPGGFVGGFAGVIWRPRQPARCVCCPETAARIVEARSCWP